jgi:hypothetical protein
MDTAAIQNLETEDSEMKIFKQILREFWLPLTLSIAWVLFNIYGQTNSSEWNIQRIVNVFGATFFLLSWMTGQFFRVKKQTKVEDSFGSIENRFEQLLDKIESRTEEMINHTTGGNSFVWYMIAQLHHESNSGILVANHEGEYALRDISARIVDLQKFNQLRNKTSLKEIQTTETIISIDSAIPNHSSLVQNWKLESEPEQSYNIFTTASNGGVTQLLRLKKIDGAWVSASKVTDSDNEIIHERIDDNYPRNAEGNIVWDTPK